MIRIAGHACTVATSALTGMRSSELMELTVACRHTDDADGTDLTRHRLVSKVVKGRLWGGEVDEWVVIEDVIRVIALAEQLTDSGPGQPLFSVCAASSVRSLRSRTKGRGTTPRASSPLPRRDVWALSPDVTPFKGGFKGSSHTSPISHR
ncbi:hypothetical protein [Streptomyces mirabilis]|uniref:hypothetical protein n=1 Tax=Streptomyces mirabilis TaxID=68239 RepID=UPI003322F4E1